MTDVVDGEGVAVVPSAHIELAEGGPVIGPEGLVEKELAVVLIGSHDANAVFERHESEGLED